MSLFGHSVGFCLLVAIALIVGYKFYHDANGGSVAAASQPNAVNPATGPSTMGLKY